MKKEDLSGQKFGSLTCLNVDIARTTRTFWICRCDCGGIKSIAAKHLKNGQIKTCNSKVHNIGENSKTWKGFGELSGKQWWIIKKGARIRGLPFRISMEDTWELFLKQNKKCSLTNLDLTLIGENGGTGNASLDRIDSLKGYTKDNIQWVHKTVNKMKMEFAQDEFIKFCKLVSKKFVDNPTPI